MPIFKPGDVVRVPFPYVETPVREVRPALVLSSAQIGPQDDLFWAVMITSSANRGWPGDVSIEEQHKAFGLPAPSVIRTEKIAVLEESSATRLGSVSNAILIEVQARVAAYLGLDDRA
jgi:mRNA interferase MazF